MQAEDREETKKVEFTQLPNAEPMVAACWDAVRAARERAPGIAAVLEKEAVDIPTPNGLVNLSFRTMDECDLSVGTGGRLWECGVMLGEFFGSSSFPPFEQPPVGGFWAGKDVLELGTGCGYVGIVLACLGANVLLTDTVELGGLVKQNITLHQEAITRGQGTAQFLSLDWIRVLEADATLRERLQSVRIIVAADCVYNMIGCQLFVHCLCGLSGLQSGVPPLCPALERIYVAHKHRHDDVDKQFVDLLEAAGLEGEEMPVEKHNREGFVHPAIDIWCLTKCSEMKQDGQ